MRPAPASVSPRPASEIGSPVPLERLVGGVDVLRTQGDLGASMIASVTHDHRAVRPGALFCCLVGRRTDGHNYAAAAVASGAVALLAERPVEIGGERHGGRAAAQVIVADTRVAMAPMAAELYGHPSRRIALAGITGTNGKTTAAHLLQAILTAAGRPAAVMGTLTGTYTTPEAPELQARLAALAAEGTEAVAMEVSSHALAQHRVDATWFEVAAFTNLSQDHLDFHGTMEDYFAAKATLFDPERAGSAVVNADDPWGRRLLASARLPTRPFSLGDAAALVVERDGSSFSWRGQPVHLRLSGRFNVVNALAAAAVAEEMGVAPDAVAAGLAAVEAVPGRFERVDGGGPVAVVVDFAHTPDGLEHVLRTARDLVGGMDGRVVAVFGAGGDRDQAKRPAMGEVVTRLADVAVLTTDNPRSEDPVAIIADVEAGARAGAGRLVVEPDRRAAIALAVGEARPGDVVVVAGKGHEQWQVFAGGHRIPFDDRAVVREVLAGR